jgi:hypothetical protein
MLRSSDHMQVTAKSDGFHGLQQGLAACHLQVWVAAQQAVGISHHLQAAAHAGHAPAPLLRIDREPPEAAAHAQTQGTIRRSSTRHHTV